MKGRKEILKSEIEKNIREVQRLNDINYTKGQPIDEFTIEMEPGTGKTFTYIKSMYELNKEYGWSKFIVMVPSIAIREGVQKSFEITQDYFQELYHKKIRYFVYNSSNSSNIANINTFASDDSIQVMIINYQAFNAKGTANRRIYEELELTCTIGIGNNMLLAKIAMDIESKKTKDGIAYWTKDDIKTKLWNISEIQRIL